MADSLRYHLHLYILFVAARLRGQMQYRASFLLAASGSFVVNILEFGVVAVLFLHIPALAGWSLGEVALLYGLSGTAFALAELPASALDDFQVRIQRGTFDRVLTRPLSPFVQVLGEDLPLRRLGRVGQGVLVLGIAQQHLALDWTAAKVLVFALSLASGVALYFAIFVLGAAFCFWTVQGKEATHVISYGGQSATSYPLDIFDDWLRRFLTFALPIGFVSYYPALFLLDRSDPLGLPDWARLLSPLAALGLGAAAALAWRAGVRRYTSTGS